MVLISQVAGNLRRAGDISYGEMRSYFVQGSSIELSADGPIRPPYAVYYQGGLTWYHAKLGVLLSLQKMLDAGLVTLP